MYEHYARLADNVKIPLLIYEHPRWQSTHLLTPELVSRLATSWNVVLESEVDIDGPREGEGCLASVDQSAPSMENGSPADWKRVRSAPRTGLRARSVAAHRFNEIRSLVTARGEGVGLRNPERKSG